MQPLLQGAAMSPGCFSDKQSQQSTGSIIYQDHANLRKTKATTSRTLCVKKSKINEATHDWSTQEVKNQAKRMKI